MEKLVTEVTCEFSMLDACITTEWQEENIAFSFGGFYTNAVPLSPFQMLTKLLFPSGEIDNGAWSNRMSLKSALRVLTLYGAMAALHDKTTGSLEWGKSADFMLLSATPFGKNPKEYLIEKRMSYAKQLLSSGQFSVSEVAQLCGYFEPCHFSREL